MLGDWLGFWGNESSEIDDGFNDWGQEDEFENDNLWEDEF